MASLPTTWYVVGTLMIVITVVSLILCIWKWREVAGLKKEVMELRDTMRMMRYEEANLSRMLHTVSKQPAEMLEENDTVDEAFVPEESVMEETITEEPVAEEIIEEESESIEEESETAEEDFVAFEEPEAEEPAEPEEEVLEEPVEEPLAEELPVEETPNETSVAEESVAEEPQEEEKPEVPVAEEAVEEVVAGVAVAEIVVEAAVAPKPRKQAINERRPAIPTDLFAAWFEENESAQLEEVQEQVSAPSKNDAQTSEKVAEEVLPVEEEKEIIAEAPIQSETGEEYTKEAEEEAAAESTELSKEDERFRRKLERIVNARMRNPNLNIDVIASQFGMGRTNFYRKVRELMGMSPNDYLRKCRMERAAELLQTTDQNIGEICGMVGIPDAQYFSRVFKSYFGVPPSSYREQ